MKPRAARACARPLTAPSTMTLRKQPNRAKCPVNCRIRRSLERVRSNSSAGYRPATFPLDSQVGSLAARPIASSSTRAPVNRVIPLLCCPIAWDELARARVLWVLMTSHERRYGST